VLPNNSPEIRDFLITRRARITPGQAGLPVYGGNRRVLGLRRDEVAMLASISTQYYTRLEQGNARGVSESVLEAISRALQLEEAERDHLYDLVRAANASNWPARRPVQQQVRPIVQQILDAFTSPALVGNGRTDILASNQLYRALYSPMFDDVVNPPNLARFLFLNPGASRFMLDWEEAAKDVISFLRAEAGRDPYDCELSNLIGQLATRSQEFRVRWATHDVKIHRNGAKRFRHPIVGDLTLDYEVLELPGQGQMIVYVAKPASASAEALNLLASWTQTSEHIDPSHQDVNANED
jgi:transcriptional regulator with XRE-family HTH domain